ncbi:hypothetical protein GCM10011494_07760 [Novosphingobium endophyticum]|uniref:Uncharacterized protein n=1 Tax=Novosphingobium endophyticum TaxID=1955250 RepID=A0A916X4F3_9SPHN|nr:hypothetical protein [Novosphingobium endophyticum]GGB91842.1 hypothetical protein GCM10011494_07760 [Novosphingobium endophyticum]
MLSAWFARPLIALGLSKGAVGKGAPWAAGASLILCAAAALALAVHLIRADAVRDDRDASNLKALEGQTEADADAADQRLKDDRAQRAQEGAYHDALNRPQPGDSTDPSQRLACERPRRDGRGYVCSSRLRRTLSRLSRPSPTIAIATDPVAREAYNIEIEAWGDRIRDAAVRAFRWMNDRGATFACGETAAAKARLAPALSNGI